MNFSKKLLVVGKSAAILLSAIGLLQASTYSAFAAADDEEEETTTPEATPAPPAAPADPNKPAVPLPGESVEQLLGTAKDFIHREKFQQAQQPLKRALELSPNNMSILNQYYEVTVKSRDWSNAQWALEKIFALDPAKEKDLYADYAQTLYNLRKYDKAKTALKKALTYGKDKDKIYKTLIRIALLEKETVLADEYYLEYFKVAPKEPELRREYADWLRKKGKVKESLPHYKVAAEGKPQDSQLHEIYAYLLMTEKDYNGSIQEYQKAMSCADTAGQARIQAAYKFAVEQQRAAQRAAAPPPPPPKTAPAAEKPAAKPPAKPAADPGKTPAAPAKK